MQLKITNVTVDTNSINPTLNIDIEIKYLINLEAPISIDGQLCSGDGKVIALLQETHTQSDYSIDVILADTKLNQTLREQKSENIYYTYLTATLSPKAIEHIEKCRERHPDKSAFFHFNFIVKNIEFSPSVPNNSPGKIQVNTFKTSGGFEVKQSDWIKKYTSHIGIGDFILLELEVPNKQEVLADWLELYERLSLRLKEMRDAIRHGDWQKVMDRSRQFFETLKIGDGKTEHQKLEENLKTLFIKDQHSPEGIQNLLNSIWHFFDYNSKFIHDKDRQGKLKPIPIATKEDAYMAYAFGVGLLNVIGCKIKK